MPVCLVPLYTNVNLWDRRYSVSTQHAPKTPVGLTHCDNRAHGAHTRDRVLYHRWAGIMSFSLEPRFSATFLSSMTVSPHNAESTCFSAHFTCVDFLKVMSKLHCAVSLFVGEKVTGVIWSLPIGWERDFNSIPSVDYLSCVSIHMSTLRHFACKPHLNMCKQYY